jgi:PilZ domain-containing protein
MDMSAELFQSIVQSVRPDGPSDANEKRGAPRASLSGKVSIIPPGESDPVEAVLRDLSVQGIGLIHIQPIKCGREFTLVFADSTELGERGVICTVARWQPISDRLFLIGAKFTSVVKHIVPAQLDDIAQLQSRLRSAGLY